MVKQKHDQDENAGSDTALLLVDVINDLDFPGNEELLVEIAKLSTNLKSLKASARLAGHPVIYLNDNFGQWRSDKADQIKYCLRPQSAGKELVRKLKPTKDDYFILKPMHSGFFGTPLQILLKSLGIKKLILAGLAADICVLYTANDAYMRGFALTVVKDCVASNTAEETERALAKMKTLLKAKILDSKELARSFESRVKKMSARRKKKAR